MLHESPVSKSDAQDNRKKNFVTTPQILKSGKSKYVFPVAPDYEFRTTCVRELVDEKIIQSIIRIINGAKRYVLQLFKRVEVLHPEFFNDQDVTYNMEDLLNMKSMADPWVGECLVR